ncbi:hypothetical protein LUZ60_002660 [Juncus effusus]|nr:hypothetical protein LUZ60_002660 [Juncus effusus]
MSDDIMTQDSYKANNSFFLSVSVYINLIVSLIHSLLYHPLSQRNPNSKFQHQNILTMKKAVSAGDHYPFLLLVVVLFFLLVSSAPSVTAQASAPQGSQNGYLQTNFSPSMAIVIVVLISAFFFLGFFSIYIRQCAGDLTGAEGPARSAAARRNRGLEPALIETFPTMLYSEAKEHKMGKGALECAVCLSEFEDDETLRLLPKCSHVFHPECIDAWLSGHVTCPVCRSNLSIVDIKDDMQSIDRNESTSERENTREIIVSQEDERGEEPVEVLPADAVVIDVDISEEEQRRREEMLELERIGSVRRAMRSKSSRRPPRLPRSHSTGHSLSSATQTRDYPERYTLKLPEPVLRSIIAAGKLKRTASLIQFPTAGEGSSRAGYRGTVRMGRSGRWPGLLVRNLSEKFSSWAVGRRGEDGEGSISIKKGEGEGSIKKGDGEGSTRRGRFGSVKVQFDCLPGGDKAEHGGA